MQFVNTLTVNGQTFTIQDPNGVRAEQLEDVVRHSEQTLTEAQKAQVRANIGITGTGAGVTPSVSFRYDEATGDLYYEVSDAEVLDEAVF